MKAAWPGVSRKVIGLAVVLDAVGADVLRDAAGFARGDARLADGIHERGLAVIDVAHESDDRRAELELFLLRRGRQFRRLDNRFDFVNAAAFLAFFTLKNEAVFLANRSRDVRLDRLVRIGENSISIKSFVIWKDFSPSCVARSFTMIGGLM